MQATITEYMMSTEGLKFSLLQTASTAEHVAPWAHSVRK